MSRVGDESLPRRRVQLEAGSIGAIEPLEIGLEYNRHVVPVFAGPRVAGGWSQVEPVPEERLVETLARVRTNLFI